MSGIRGLSSLLLHTLPHNPSDIDVFWSDTDEKCFRHDFRDWHGLILLWIASDKASNIVWLLCAWTWSSPVLQFLFKANGLPSASVWDVCSVLLCSYAGTQTENVDVHVSVLQKESQFFLGCEGLHRCKACPRIPCIRISWDTCRNSGAYWLVVLRGFLILFGVCLGFLNSSVICVDLVVSRSYFMYLCLFCVVFLKPFFYTELINTEWDC